MEDWLRPLTDQELRRLLGKRSDYRIRLKDLSLRERIMRGVDTTDPDRCWRWQRGRRGDGYGEIAYRGESLGAHRASYIAFYGSIPEGRHVCHDCPGRHDRLCVNPLHLYAGTQSQNMRDRCQSEGNRTIVRGVRFDDPEPGPTCLVAPQSRPDRWSRLRDDAERLLATAGTRGSSAS